MGWCGIPGRCPCSGGPGERRGMKLVSAECCDSVVGLAFKWLDRTVKWLGPLYALVAATLVLIDAYVFFTTVIENVAAERGTYMAWVHTAIGVWLLFNVMLNHLMCVFTDPGCTSAANQQDLQAAVSYDWRFCKKCNLPKPPLAHHCSVCNRCILRMDHHCPWMANCVGYRNYRYFFLYLFYMWVGALYSAAMSFFNIGGMRLTDSLRYGRQLLPAVMFLLACSVFLAISILLGWHVFLVATGQGSIDAMSSYIERQEAERAGRKHVNPFHLGAARNFQEALDVSGKLWWATWMLPSWRPKRGKGWALPRAHHGPPSHVYHSYGLAYGGSLNNL